MLYKNCLPLNGISTSTADFYAAYFNICSLLAMRRNLTSNKTQSSNQNMEEFKDICRRIDYLFAMFEVYNKKLTLPVLEEESGKMVNFTNAISIESI